MIRKTSILISSFVLFLLAVPVWGQNTSASAKKASSSEHLSMEQRMINAGLVNVQSLDSTIKVKLMYATTDNFMHCNMYGDLKHAYLQKDVAEKLVRAQHYLKSLFPYYSLIIYDAARPRSVQYFMWDSIKVSKADRSNFLCNPAYGSIHSYGAAVDLSIVDNLGIPLDMGTKYDYCGVLAYPEKENELLQEGKLTYWQVANRELLRKVMVYAGFQPIKTEWWHFNSCSRDEARLKYKVIP